jgi:tRNA nucleotidyltransferase (CCA-adding enzyme)
LSYEAHTKALLARIFEVVNWFDLLFLEGSYYKWMVYLLGLTEQLPPAGLEEMIRRLALPPRYRKRLLEGATEGALVLQRAHGKRMGPQEIYTLFKPLSTEAILYIMAKTEDEGIKKAISLFFTTLNAVRVSLRGEDLRHLGIKPGPLYHEILNALLLARLEGTVKTKEDELGYVKRHYRDRCV